MVGDNFGKSERAMSGGLLQTKIRRGTPPPLFDRIVDDKNEYLGGQFLNVQELQESILNDLSVILNVRCTVRKVIYKDNIHTIPLFGFPDFFGLEDLNNFDAANPQEWPAAALFIETAIQAAEPRLREIRVTIENFSAVEQILSVMVSAFVNVPHLLKEIHCPLELHHSYIKPRSKS